MNRLPRFRALLLALLLALPGAALAENTPEDPVAVVSYDYTALTDWMPSYRLTLPGTLLELTHTEGLLSVSLVQTDELSPMEYLSGQLDRAGETLSVSDASIAVWEDPFEGGGRCLSFTYTYPEGDEYHISRSWTAKYADGLLIELSVDTWGAESVELMNAVCAVFIEGGFTLTRFSEPTETVSTISDIRENEGGAALLQLTPPGVAFTSEASFYPLSLNAVVLFPNPDDPTMFLPVEPNAPALIDAVLTYEENSDSPATFRAVISGGEIVYMEYVPTY